MVEGAHELGMTNMLNVCYTLVRLSFEGLTRETEPATGMMKLVQCLGRCQTRHGAGFGQTLRIGSATSSPDRQAASRVAPKLVSGTT